MTTTSVTHDDVLHLAQLSSLQLTTEELTSLQHELTSILEYIAQLDELDTTGVEPTYQVTDLENVWREDVVAKSNADREALLDLAPASINNQIKVPKVL
jgi:aspartyl-tRNA(Asn)/glutamyl-tRNA(Gln) amidotransferase subunit C